MIIIPMPIRSGSSEEYCSNCNCERCVSKRKADAQPATLFDKIIMTIFTLTLIAVLVLCGAMILDTLLNYAISDWLFR